MKRIWSSLVTFAFSMLDKKMWDYWENSTMSYIYAFDWTYEKQNWSEKFKNFSSPPSKGEEPGFAAILFVYFSAVSCWSWKFTATVSSKMSVGDQIQDYLQLPEMEEIFARLPSMILMYLLVQARVTRAIKLSMEAPNSFYHVCFKL